MNYRLEVKNSGGHSSLPRKDNAIYHLADGLGRLGSYDFPVKLNETTRLWFERSAAIEDAADRAPTCARSPRAAPTPRRSRACPPTRSTTRRCAPPASPRCWRADTPPTRCRSPRAPTSTAASCRASRSTRCESTLRKVLADDADLVTPTSGATSPSRAFAAAPGSRAGDREAHGGVLARHAGHSVHERRRHRRQLPAQRRHSRPTAIRASRATSTMSARTARTSASPSRRSTTGWNISTGW